MIEISGNRVEMWISIPRLLHLKFFKITQYCLLITVIPALFTYCESSQSKVREDQVDKVGMVKEQNPVDVTTLASSTFSNEIISNGKLLSISKSDLQFKTGEVIMEINVANGSMVNQGQVIARLDDDDLKRKKQQAQINIENARMELEDFFLSHVQLMADTVSAEGK